MIIEKIVVGEFQTNCYIVGCAKTKKGFIIDPGDDSENIKAVIHRLGIAPSFILNTHGHMDHIKDNDKFNLPVYIHSQDKECLTNPAKNLSQLFGTDIILNIQSFAVEDGSALQAGELSFKVIHTPGHSPGCICLQHNDIVFTGDTLFCGGYGRTDFPGSSPTSLFKSIRDRLMTLPDNTVIHPGHGPSSTIGQEREFF